MDSFTCRLDTVEEIISESKDGSEDIIQNTVQRTKWFFVEEKERSTKRCERTEMVNQMSSESSRRNSQLKQNMKRWWRMQSRPDAVHQPRIEGAQRISSRMNKRHSLKTQHHENAER